MNTPNHDSAPDQRPLAFVAAGGEMGELIRAFDWSRTPLGPLADWPQSLKTAVSICLDSRFPIPLWWGPDLRLIYNDAWRPVLGKTKHPDALGRPGREVWPEIWHIIGPMLEGVLATGQATWSDDQLLPLDRNGYLEEAYFTYSYSPIRDEAGRVGGVFSAVNETTLRVVGERRLRTLRELAAQASAAKTPDEAGGRGPPGPGAAAGGEGERGAVPARPRRPGRDQPGAADGRAGVGGKTSRTTCWRGWPTTPTTSGSCGASG